MLIGESGAVTDLWEAARKKLPKPRLDRPGQPVYAIADPPPAGGTGMRAATVADLDLLVPSCAAAHHEELGVDPLRRDPERLPLAHADADRGRALVALGGGRRDPVQGRGLRVDAGRDSAPAGVDRSAGPEAGFAGRALRDLIRLLLEGTPDRLPVRAGGERRRDQAVRVGRDAATCSTTARVLL